MIQIISDNLAFKALSLIKHGQLKLTNYDGKKYCFGENRSPCPENTAGVIFEIRR